MLYLFINFYHLSAIGGLYSYTHMQCLPTKNQAKWQEVQCVKQLCDEENLYGDEVHKVQQHNLIKPVGKSAEVEKVIRLQDIQLVR